MSGCCHGFEIRSDFTWRFLREGSGNPLEVIELPHLRPDPSESVVLEWIPTRENPLSACLYARAEAGTYRLVLDDAETFWIDVETPRIGVVASGDPIRTEERLWGFPSLLSFLHRGDLPVHGASVEVNGRALLLCGPSRHGKTSLAAGFHRAGHRLLAEDLSCLRLGDPISVVPGPASLRVRHDMVEPLSLPDVELLAEDEDRVHFSIALHRRGTAEPVPLAGIVLLKDFSPEIHLERASPLAAIQDLWFLSFNLPADEDRARCFAGIADLCGQVPVWNLTRPMLVEALDDTIDRLAAIAEG